MWARWLTWFCITLLRWSDLPLRERAMLTSALLQHLEALPLRDMISYSDEGILLVNGQQLGFEKMKVLREAAIAALGNQALQLLEQQVLSVAVQRGLHQADTTEKVMFYRAAIWYGGQLAEHLQKFAQQGQELSLE